MIPGRNLDVLVAEKVFGLRTGMANFESGSVPIILDKFLDIEVPYYSTQIEAAWTVVEKVKSIQPHPNFFGLARDHLQRFTIQHEEARWKAGWAPINLDGVMTVEAEAESAPHAICLAALKALGVEV